MQVWEKSRDVAGYDLSSLHVLIVEDNEHMQALFKEILRMFNIASIQVADDGESGFNTFNSMQPDLIVADWAMVPVDGLEMVERIRRDPDSSDPYVPVILVTGNTEYHQVKQAVDGGITEFLAKPISAQSLYSRICKVIEHPRNFVRAQSYVGPDRRRQTKADQNGPKRRHSDKE